MSVIARLNSFYWWTHSIQLGVAVRGTIVMGRNWAKQDEAYSHIGEADATPLRLKTVRDHFILSTTQKRDYAQFDKPAWPNNYITTITIISTVFFHIFSSELSAMTSYSLLKWVWSIQITEFLLCNLLCHQNYCWKKKQQITWTFL